MHLRNSASFVAIALAGGLASTTAIADEMFLKFSGGTGSDIILGDSTDPQHAGEIELLSYSLSVDAESSWTKGGGASVGKPNPGPLIFTAAMNRSVPTIVKYITTGKASPQATLSIRSDAGGKKAGDEYVRYTFEGVFFTSVGQSLSGDGRAVSAVSGVYKTLKIQQFAPGNPVPVSCVLWDIPAGTATSC